MLLWNTRKCIISITLIKILVYYLLVIISNLIMHWHLSLIRVIPSRRRYASWIMDAISCLMINEITYCRIIWSYYFCIFLQICILIIYITFFNLWIILLHVLCKSSKSLWVILFIIGLKNWLNLSWIYNCIRRILGWQTWLKILIWLICILFLKLLREVRMFFYWSNLCLSRLTLNKSRLFIKIAFHRNESIVCLRYILKLLRIWLRHFILISILFISINVIIIWLRLFLIFIKTVLFFIFS